VHRKSDHALHKINDPNQFAGDTARGRQWQAFLKKINQPDVTAFADVIGEIKSRLKPIWFSLVQVELEDIYWPS
jgi:hypothetical protein